jgi:hypothetical protein
MSEFEVGKRYRTRDGKDEVLIESMPFEEEGRRKLVYRLDILEKRIDEFERRFSPAPTSFPGGWVNIYGDHNNYLIGGLFSTKQDADNYAASGRIASGRIACIRLPDFTEGEGTL